MDFIVIGNREWFKSEGKNIAYLKIDHWDDYDFCTQFSVKLFDDNGVGVELGEVKIGYKGQPRDTNFPTYKKLDLYVEIMKRCALKDNMTPILEIYIYAMEGNGFTGCLNKNN